MRNLHLTYMDKQPHFKCERCHVLTLLDFVVDGCEWGMGAVCPSCDHQLWVDEQPEEQHGPLHASESWS